MEFTLRFVHVFFVDVVYASTVLVFLIFLIALIGLFIGRIEGWSRFDALYHAFINATTVGYGDFHPTKRSSKKLAVALAFVGLIFTGMVVAVALHAANDAYAQVYDGSGFRDR